MGLVYLGAAILIVIVGLRGLGAIAGTVGLIPSFLIGADNKIDPYWVMLAFLLEFGMLFLLGVVTFYTPSEYVDILHTDEEESKIKSSAKDLKNELRDLKDFADEEMRVIEDYVEKFDSLSQKVRDIQLSSIQAISKMKDTIEN